MVDDLVAGNTQEAIDVMKASLPDLRKCIEVRWGRPLVQQERAEEVNQELISFLQSVN